MISCSPKGLFPIDCETVNKYTSPENSSNYHDLEVVCKLLIGKQVRSGFSVFLVIRTPTLWQLKPQYEELCLLFWKPIHVGCSLLSWKEAQHNPMSIGLAPGYNLAMGKGAKAIWLSEHALGRGCIPRATDCSRAHDSMEGRGASVCCAKVQPCREPRRAI